MDEEQKINAERKRADEQKIDAERKTDARRINDGHQGMNELLQELADQDSAPDEPQWWRALAALRDIQPTAKKDIESPTVISE